ncbi:MAG: restriction endonuclease subunit R [Firmicutes bacterium HGW-Firmicutes-19]|nr:MAG: restriction endonuclease subunit R [Firmicutes bacterium HGW-Firmicutes-19]
MELKPFQQRAVQELFSGFYSDKSEIVLKSCTGSGKTIIISSFINQLIKRESDYVIIWLTPGNGELELQSKSKMNKYYPRNATKQLSDILLLGFERGDIVYINWELVNKKGNNALKDGEKSDLIDHIKVASNNGLKFAIIIDESHSHDTIKSSIVKDYFKPEIVIKMSATPNNYENPYLIDIPESVVIQEELIKKRIIINENIDSNETIDDQTFYLLDKALNKRDEIKRELDSLNVNINPLVLVQIPNNSNFMLNKIEEYFYKQEITYENGKLGVWLSDKKANIEDIEKNTNFTSFLIIKQAIATGWDCPRAHVLVKLRGNTSEKFDIQTIGRIRRMPEAKHYLNEIVDSAYLYTVDMKFVEDVKSAIGKNAIDAKKIYLKEEYKNVVLIKENRSYQPIGVDPEVALKCIHKHYIDRYTNSMTVELKTSLEHAGYIFENHVIRSLHRGTVTVLDLRRMNQLDKISIFEPLNTHTHGRDFHNILSEIGSKIGMTYDLMRVITRRLFESRVKPYNKKILKLDTKELYSFVINNRDLLVNDFSDAMSDVNLQSLNLVQKLKIKEEFRFPNEVILTYDSSSRVQRIYTKNVYEGYLSSSEPRSNPEREFEKYIQESRYVKWFYKNGDKGQEYFSIVYQDNSGKQKLFYPDYVVCLNDKVWIIETKGGFKASGESEDIDKFSPIKFAVLKEYEKENNIRVGFVRKDKKSSEFFIAYEKLDDDIESSNWHLLESIFQNGE